MHSCALHAQCHEGGTPMMLKEKIRTIPHFPKQGIMFRDITTLLKDPLGFKFCVEDLASSFKGSGVDAVVGIESRGFILGGAIAHILGVGFVPIRKEGKLPSKRIREEYELEYGKGVLEIHEDALIQGQKVIVIDDLLATGGTALAAARLIERLGGTIVFFGFIVDLPELGGGKKITDAGYSYYAQTNFEGH